MSMLWWIYCSPYCSCRRLRLHAVDASSPKNARRISLSIPTTLNPRSQKNRTASEPIRPAEPVTTTTFIVFPSHPNVSRLVRYQQPGIDLAHSRGDKPPVEPERPLAARTGHRSLQV